jgi:hypothetical protein
MQCLKSKEIDDTLKPSEPIQVEKKGKGRQYKQYIRKPTLFFFIT